MTLWFSSFREQSHWFKGERLTASSKQSKLNVFASFAQKKDKLPYLLSLELSRKIATLADCGIEGLLDVTC